MNAHPALAGPPRRKVTARASGKVNLQLAVGERGDDGYHPLVTVFQAVGLHESVSAQTRDDGVITLSMDALPGYPCDLGAIPIDHTNLAWRAAEAVRAAYGVSDGCDLHIVKGVPTAGGMAGGSADAAAALVACAELWDCAASKDDLMEIAAGLGADVPFAVMGHTALGVGRGDQLSPVMTRGEFHWVFATQTEGLSTPQVFEHFDRQVEAGERVLHQPQVDAELMQALMAGNPEALGAALRNDLQDAALALMPRLRGVIDVAEQAQAMGVVVSGSGPTVAALARNKHHALAIATHLEQARVADAVVIASGPATGAVVI